MVDVSYFNVWFDFLKIENADETANDIVKSTLEKSVKSYEDGIEIGSITLLDTKKRISDEIAKDKMLLSVNNLHAFLKDLGAKHLSFLEKILSGLNSIS